MQHRLKPPPRIYAKSRQQQGQQAKRWYNIAAGKGDDGNPRIDVEIYDEIGAWGINAAAFIRELRALDDGKSPVCVAINSPGGDVFDGIAISNAVHRLGARCTVRIDGLAASAASIIAVGAYRVVIAENAMMMIHNPWTFAAGDADELRKLADSLDLCRNALVATYRRKAAALDEAELVRMLDEETWLPALDAVALGLADEVVAGSDIKACADPAVLARYRNAPQLDDEPAPVPEPEPSQTPAPTPAPAPAPAPALDAAALALRVLGACREAGIGDLAEAVLRIGSLEGETAADERVAHAVSVHTLCVAARLPELAGEYIAAGLNADAVRARLFDRLHAEQADLIDNKLPVDPPDPAPQAKAMPSPWQVYADRRAAARSRQSTQGNTR